MKHFVVIDLEMCKVAKPMRVRYKRANEIIQIGAVIVDENYEIKDKYMSYVKPEFGELDSFINRLTGIKKDNLRNAQKFAEVLEDFVAWIPDGEVIMVSWSQTDLRQLQYEMGEKKIKNERLESLFETWNDCQKTFSQKIKKERAYSLEEALIAADIMQEGNAHDGLSDAYNTALLFIKMEKEPELKLNPIYESARTDQVNHLSVSLGDLFGNIDLSSLPDE